MRPFRDIPIERKLLVAILATTALALLLSGLSFLVLDTVWFRQQLRRDLSALARIIAENSTAAVAFDDAKSAGETLTALRERPHVLAACIYRLDGSVLASYSPAGQTCPPPRAFGGLVLRGGRIEVFQTIALKDRPVGHLALLYDLGEIAERLRLYGLLVLAVLLISGAIAVRSSVRLRERIVAPIEELARDAAHVAETRDYTIRARKQSRDELGVLVESFNAMLFSIQSRDDDLRKALADREQALAQAKNARDQLEMITDTMASAVTRCGRDHRLIWASRQYSRWLNLPPGQIAGQPLAGVIGENAFAALRPFIDRVLAGERVEYEVEADFKTIGPRWIRGTYVPTRAANGEVDGWVAELSDITALKRAQADVVEINRQLQRLNSSLARSNEDLERFAYVASHDLQEPLRIVTTYSQLLIRTYGRELRGEAAAFIDNIVDGARRMQTLLADLLAYTGISAEIERPVENVDLNAALETAKSHLKAAIAESGAQIASDPLPSARGHEGHFVSLLQNLIGNAIKYRSADPPRIRIAAGRQGGEMRIEVSDNGIGIAPEYHQKIFVPFKRLHGRKIPGSGIGLAICQRVVERYGGRIWVESQVGAGSKFIFTLPEAAPPAREAASAGEAPHERAAL
jgi:signal transduction histidine kinase